LKRRETRITPRVRLRKVNGPLMAWIVPAVVCGVPSRSIGNSMAIRTPTAHIPNRLSPIRDRAGLGTPWYNAMTKAQEARLMLKKAEVIKYL